ncbi:hypothetical protein [Campylobacter sp. 19-13652]|uniref:hypothetical protein n=1 Tax=Campylobacter sp. 19-13652 TaxID=2840180 RepID=UPI001C773DB6|nr:hypothetical protein [Campylobacter sp. 19-13652]BCX79810.1 hypothetical protein LBC_12720 [Campylobacter sp. 19-13652]
MKTAIILSLFLFTLAGCAHSYKSEQATTTHHHTNTHEHHMDANGKMMASCPMMKDFQLRDMPNTPLKNSAKEANEIETAILENFKGEIKAVAYAKYPKGEGIEFISTKNINRISLRKIGKRLANFIREMTGSSALIEVNTKINGVAVSKMY